MAMARILDLEALGDEGLFIWDLSPIRVSGHSESIRLG